MSDTTKNEPPPSWIDVAFVHKALLNGGEKNPVVTSFSTEIATQPGDNYSSVIYRVKAALNDGSDRSFLIKTISSGDEMESWVRESQCFSRESTMLAEIIPQIEALLEEVAPGRWPHLAARCPMHCDSTEIFIVMEDLRTQGFRLADRKRGLGLRHSLLAIRSLARYHAASHLLIKKDPSLITRLDSSYRRQQENITNFVLCTVQAAADVCKTWPGFEEEAVLLEKLKPVFVKKLTELNEPRPDCFNVITHGDYWTNNMMFRYDENGTPCDQRMVDLQLSHVASPTLDLLYFLTTSLGENVSIYHQDLLIREYYFALKEALTLLGMEAPSFETFMTDMEAHGPHSLLGTVSVTPIVKATKAPDLNAAMTGDQSALNYLYNTPEVKKSLQRMLPDLKRRGWLPA